MRSTQRICRKCSGKWASRSSAAAKVDSFLQKVKRTCEAPSGGIAVEARPRHDRHTDLFHQKLREHHIVGISARTAPTKLKAEMSVMM